MNGQTTHVVAYTANPHGNQTIEHGIALVVTAPGARPDWHACRAQIPSFVTGQYLGLAPNPPKEPHP